MGQPGGDGRHPPLERAAGDGKAHETPRLEPRPGPPASHPPPPHGPQGGPTYTPMRLQIPRQRTVGAVTPRTPVPLNDDPMRAVPIPDGAGIPAIAGQGRLIVRAVHPRPGPGLAPGPRAHYDRQVMGNRPVDLWPTERPRAGFSSPPPHLKTPRDLVSPGHILALIRAGRHASTGQESDSC